MSDTETWLEWLCGLSGNEMLCEVDRGYIQDGFNLFGLRHQFEHYQECLDLILDKVAFDACKDADIAKSAFKLYGLIHARFIVTGRGLEAMLRKYRVAEFGRCPRMLCRDQPVVPVGMRDELKKGPLKLFCPRCRDVYNVTSSKGTDPLDGAFFGTSFAHLFVMTYEKWIPKASSRQRDKELYVPRIFGFRVHNHTDCKCIQENGNGVTEGSSSDKKDKLKKEPLKALLPAPAPAAAPVPPTGATASSNASQGGQA
ncbi:unnamed protein product [Chrysoparadoxa australica]